MSVHAQQKNPPLLEKVISVSISGETVDAALKKIGKAGGFSFSYKSSIISATDRITVTMTNATVREVLDQVFKGDYAYRQKGNHIILTKVEKQASNDSQVIDGYIIDEATGRRLKNVSVYDPVTMSSTVTDAYGYFRIEIKKPTGDEIRLAVNKSTYADTVVVVPRAWNSLVTVPIRENAKKISTLADTVGHRIKKFWLDVRRPSTQAANLENITDTLHRKHQFGVFPFVGTNGKLSGNVINDYSFNLIGGYSFGNTKFELGGLFNSERSDVSGVQVAGLANGVAGRSDGVQLAGLINVVRDSSRSFQVAGLVNANVAPKSNAGIAGLVNVDVAERSGVGVAGLFNVGFEAQSGVYLAGLGNVAAREAGPLQMAGLFNYAREIEGTQIAGLFNITPKRIRGLQLSGLVNVAKEVDGAQLGVFNFTSRIEGVPVGVMSIVAHGYHKIEVSSDEIFYTNIAFRTGVRQFYNILTAGALPQTFDEPATTWTFGYGIGTAPRLSKKMFLNVDLTSSQIVRGPIEEINLLNKLCVGVDFQVAKMFSIFAGVTLNAQLTDPTYDGYPDIFTNYQPGILYRRTYNENLYLESWLGGKIGVRFL